MSGPQLVGVDSGAALRIDGSDSPSFVDMRASWAIVVVRRFAAPLGPISVGYIGRVGTKAEGLSVDAGSIALADPFDYQAGWGTAADKRSVTRRIDIMPCEGFPLESILISRHELIVRCDEIPDRALELVHSTLSAAWAMRSAFIKAGSRLSVV